MLSSKMFEVSSTVCRLPNFLLIPVRRNVTKAEILRKLMKENKKCFGGLIETAKEKRERLKSLGSIKLKNSLENQKVPNEGELFWSMGSTGGKSWKFVKSRKQRIDSNASEEKSRIESVGDKAVCLSETKSLGESGDIPIQNVEGSDESWKGISPGKSDSELENNMSHLSIMNPLKGEDQWIGSEILSLKPKEKHEMILPGVTKILQKTMPEEHRMRLQKWKERMIGTMGELAFEEYCNKLLEDSKLLHLLMEKSLKKEELPPIPADLIESFKSMKLILENLTDVRLIESHVVHPALGYRGFIDCVANYRGHLCLIDWKKSEKVKRLSTTYDSPLQLSAYIGALNADPNYPFQVKSGILAIVYTRGQPPTVLNVSEEKLGFYWREWLKRLECYKNMEKNE